MPVEQIKISSKDISSFQSILDTAVSNPKHKNVVLFFTNPSWCPDCVEAEETVNEFLSELPEDRSVALIVEVEREPYKAADAWETYLYRKVRRRRSPSSFLFLSSLLIPIGLSTSPYFGLLSVLLLIPLTLLLSLSILKSAFVPFLLCWFGMRQRKDNNKHVWKSFTIHERSLSSKLNTFTN
jgi:thiol-disulfide isomerase/thioredoxin